MSDRIKDIRKGFLVLLPVLDERGRAIIYYDPALSEEQLVVQDEVGRDNRFFLFKFMILSFDNHLIDVLLLLL